MTDDEKSTQSIETLKFRARKGDDGSLLQWGRVAFEFFNQNATFLGEFSKNRIKKRHHRHRVDQKKLEFNFISFFCANQHSNGCSVLQSKRADRMLLESFLWCVCCDWTEESGLNNMHSILPLSPFPFSTASNLKLTTILQAFLQGLPSSIDCLCPAWSSCMEYFGQEDERAQSVSKCENDQIIIKVAQDHLGRRCFHRQVCLQIAIDHSCGTTWSYDQSSFWIAP